ncbi:MAG TPA: NUDIX hydrolase [Noviherbaspirillum sp.]|uniref:NUDIX hydrolase n=1 Tax=Noviherbaspirillum sp. TaxID=1926288 RepID=UPI002D52BF04|nr:NUDIX hydrolase [Noviherbaspirillum sp.]HYD97170.1 NUDIX hydrolase [Noviherbaspirillum sp.]
MFKKPAPVSVGIIPSSTPGHIILVERSDGGIALPGGNVDEMEDASAALNREVFEETGLELDVSQWRLFYSAITPHNKLLLFSYYPQPVALPLAFTPNDEVLRVFSAAWNTPLKFPLHETAVQKWSMGAALVPAQPACTETWLQIGEGNADGFRSDDTRHPVRDAA